MTNLKYDPAFSVIMFHTRQSYDVLNVLLPITTELVHRSRTLNAHWPGSTIKTRRPLLKTVCCIAVPDSSFLFAFEGSLPFACSALAHRQRASSSTRGDQGRKTLQLVPSYSVQCMLPRIRHCMPKTSRPLRRSPSSSCSTLSHALRNIAQEMSARYVCA